MRTIGIIGAMEEEIVALKQKMDIVSVKRVVGTDFYMGKMRNVSMGIVLVRSGIGKVNAAVCAQVLIDLYAVDCIINIGVAGALSKDLNIGDLVISKDTVSHDMDTTAFGEALGVIPRMKESFFKADDELIQLATDAAEAMGMSPRTHIGRVASGDQFISHAEKKQHIWQHFKPLCVEMEGAAIAQTCYLNKIPFVILRSISDQSNDNAHQTFEQFVDLAAKQSSELVEKMLQLWKS